MHKPLYAWMVILTAVTPVAAQSLWTPQIGLQGGYTRIKPAGTGADDAVGLIDLPGSSYATAIYGYGAVFGVIPSSRRVAVELQLGTSQITTESSGSASVLRGTLRLDYALSPGFYVGAGGSLLYLDAGSSHESQLGVHAAAGYRRGLTETLNGRVELQATFHGKADQLPPIDSYAAVVGVSTAVGRHPGARGPASRARAWDPAVGLTAGYLRTHIVGDSTGADVASITLPGIGSSFAPLGLAIPGPTTLFIILPVGTKIAVEGGLDVHSISQSGGSGTATAINASGRLDYAVAGGWYAAAGGALTNVNPSSGSGGTLTSGSLAWGYRFGLGAGIGGRVEASFHMQQSNSDLNAPAMNTFGLLFGTSVALK